MSYVVTKNGERHEFVSRLAALNFMSNIPMRHKDRISLTYKDNWELIRSKLPKKYLSLSAVRNMIPYFKSDAKFVEKLQAKIVEIVHQQQTILNQSHIQFKNKPLIQDCVLNILRLKNDLFILVALEYKKLSTKGGK